MLFAEKNESASKDGFAKRDKAFPSIMQAGAAAVIQSLLVLLILLRQFRSCLKPLFYFNGLHEDNGWQLSRLSLIALPLCLSELVCSTTLPGNR